MDEESGTNPAEPGTVQRVQKAFERLNALPSTTTVTIFTECLLLLGGYPSMDVSFSRCFIGSAESKRQFCVNLQRTRLRNVHHKVLLPLFTVSGDDRCVLYCRVFQSNLYYPLKEKVIDGTPCTPESFDICVNGQCKSAGCDHILSSDVRLGEYFNSAKCLPDSVIVLKSISGFRSMR